MCMCLFFCVERENVSGAYHFFETMVDAHCTRRRGFHPTYNGWLRFIRLGLGHMKFMEYVNHFLEKAVRYPRGEGEEIVVVV